MNIVPALGEIPRLQDLLIIWEELLSLENLLRTFQARIAPSPLRGVDRLGPDAFSRNLGRELAVIQGKCLDGSYRFTPYLESLRSKGRGKLPRVLAIASVRDRIVLYLLKEALQRAFAECVPRRLPNQYIRDIVASGLYKNGVSIVKADIKSFYDELDHIRLFEILESRIPRQILRLVERAIRNPTVSPTEHNRSTRRLRPISKGVPQGLSISNILAEIYVRDLDRNIAPNALGYYRYVDDILMFTKSGTEEVLYDQLSADLSQIGLSLSPEKKASGPAQIPLDYLGYRLKLPDVSVKAANINRLIDSLATYFARYHHNVDARFRNEWLDPYARERIFLDELNERITGAVSENRRYGWLFYFIEITDLGLLYKIDHIVRDLWQRFLGHPAPPDLKRFARAYHEARFHQLGTYIHNYDRYDSTAAKIDFLVRRGHLDPTAGSQFTVEQVDHLFRETRYRNLVKLEADVGTIS